MKIVLDTNFLIDLVRFKVDLTEIESFVHEPYALATSGKVVAELKSLSKGNSKTSAYAKLALKLIDELHIQVIKSKQASADKEIIELAKESITATNDKELRKKLKSFGKKTIYLKSKKHLAIG